MASISTKDHVVSVPKEEYLRLKNLEKRFGEFLEYVEHLMDIREARREIKEGKLIPQEKLFRKLGLS